MSDHDLFSYAVLVILILFIYILYLRHERDVWKKQALTWTKWLKAENKWNDEGLLEMLTEQEKKLYHLRREYQIDE